MPYFSIYIVQNSFETGFQPALPVIYPSKRRFG